MIEDTCALAHGPIGRAHTALSAARFASKTLSF